MGMLSEEAVEEGVLRRSEESCSELPDRRLCTLRLSASSGMDTWDAITSRRHSFRGRDLFGLTSCTDMSEKERDSALCDEALTLRETAEDCRERVIEESRRVNGEGASSSSLSGKNCQKEILVETGIARDCTRTHLSLHPSPVVRPIPPLSVEPSRCRTRRRGVSRASLIIPDLVITESARESESVRFAAIKTVACQDTRTSTKYTAWTV